MQTKYIMIIWYQVIAAEGEQKASRALREAAEIVSESPAAIQLRYLQVTNPKSTFETQWTAFFTVVDLFADTQLHIGREEFDHHFPCSNRHNSELHGSIR